MRTTSRDVWKDWPRAATVSVDDRRLSVELQDGRQISLPIAWFAWLENASEVQRQAFRLSDDGAAIHWDELDESLSVPSLLGLPEVPPPDSGVGSYVVDYRREDRYWLAEVRGTDLATFGRSLPAAKGHARNLLMAYLEVPDLVAAGITVVDEVHEGETIKA